MTSFNTENNYATKQFPPDLIQKSLGTKLLLEIAQPLMQTLGTSVAIYEKSGIYALELIDSNWCQKLNLASFELCHTDNKENASSSGKWLCHESCWSECSKYTIEEKKSIDIICQGGLHILGVPIFFDKEVIGSINAGYGSPPSNIVELQKISHNFNIEINELIKYNHSPCLINSENVVILQNYLTTLAHLIGVLVQSAQIQKEWELSSKRSLKYLDLAGDITVVLDKDANIQFLNKSGCLLLEYSDEELIGKNWFDNCIPLDMRKQIKNVFLNIFKGNDTAYLVYENPVLTKTGKMPLILWRSDYIHNPEGNIIASVSVGIDVTEKKQMELQIQLDQQKLNLFLETVPFGITFVDKNGQITYANKYAEQVLNLEKISILNRVYNDSEWIIENLDGTPFPDEKLPFNQVKTSLKPINSIMHSIKGKNGEKIYLSINASPIFDSNHDFDGMLSSIEDITEKIRNEQEFLKMRNIESLGVLAGGIAHDFNNILTSLIGSLSLASAEIDSKNYEDLKNIIQDASIAAERAGKLTMQLLTFSKGGAPVLKNTSIVNILSETAKFTLRGSQTQFKIIADPDINEIIADVDQMVQVFQNIFLNAIQAMPNGGTMAITVKRTNPKDLNRFNLPNINFIHICITDHGVGIPLENLSKIFDPYFTTKPNGTGLGLSICYSIIKKHNGFIFVNSEIGKGTTFHLFIPQ